MSVSAPLYKAAVGLEPRPFQTEGVEFLWRKKRAMITDAPGLGKTPQGALAAMPPALVVCPNYLVSQWRDWLNEHLPDMPVVACIGNRSRKSEALETEAAFTIINIEMLRTHYDQLMSLTDEGRFTTVIFDESHHLRNKGSMQAQNAVELASKIERCYLLTATPIWKDPDDLFMQFRILHPTVFTSYWDFIDMYCVTDDTRYGTKVYGIKPEKASELDELLNVMRLGRNYQDAGRYLPPLITKVIRPEFDPARQKMYNDAVNYYIEDFDLALENWAQVMHTLRALTMFDGKVDAIVNAVSESQTPSVVFCWYKDIAMKLATEIKGSTWITGDLPVEERRNRAKGSKTVIATISSLSEGIDLSWARQVIFAEEHYTPGAAIQALARVRRERRGGEEANQEPVIVHYIMTKGTIDEVVHAAARRRDSTIKEVLREALGI